MVCSPAHPKQGIYKCYELEEKIIERKYPQGSADVESSIVVWTVLGIEENSRDKEPGKYEEKIYARPTEARNAVNPSN